MTRILVAEDERDLRTLITLGLRMHGVDAQIVEDGSAAVAAAREHPFELVLLDLNMPHVDGLTAARQIRRLKQHGTTPFLFLTGDIAAESQSLLENSDVLMKPFTVGQLIERINQLLANTENRPA